MKQNWTRTLSIVVGLSTCFVFFQNFSLDNEYKDIREIAPKGEFIEPSSPYFPEKLQATSLQGLSNELLKHNLSGQMRQLENQMEDWTGFEIGERPSHGSDQQNIGRAPSSYRLRTGHLNRDRIGVQLESDFNIKCEYSALQNDVQVSLDTPVGQNARLSLHHSTDNHKSSVNFSYAW